MGARANRVGGGSIVVEQVEGRVLLAADFVLEWNAVALQTVADDHTPAMVSSPDQGGPTRTARALAIVHAAIFDAVNSIDGSYTPYLVDAHGPKGASIGAAVAQAAHDTLVALYPKQTSDFDDALKLSLKKVKDGKAENQGVEAGAHVARAILKARRNDGSGAASAYTGSNLPGVFQTYAGEPAPLTPAWGSVTPFTMASGTQFLAPPPPGMDSPQYATAYNEVKRLGGDGVTTPTDRTPEQTEIGIFWGYDGAPGLGTPPRLYNQIARVVAAQEGNTEVENARMFALVNLAMADAGIASWGTKYTYNFWRPMRGMRQTDPSGAVMDDGNPATDVDPTWTPLGAPFTNAPPGGQNFTPPFPAYTSGHATFGAAAFQTLARFYGTDNIAFTFTSDEFNGVNKGNDGVVRPLSARSFTSFSQAAEENGQSRIYLGIHWAFDKTAGIAQGNAIANYAFEHELRPRRGGHENDRGNDGPACAHGRDRDSSSGNNAHDDEDDLFSRVRLRL